MRDLSQPTRVFISYARTDGANVAEKLYQELQKQGIEAWRDTHNFDPYADFSSEIKEAIRDCTHMVVCITADLQRQDSFARREIAYGLIMSKPILPLIFEDSILPITIIMHSAILFHDWKIGLHTLLKQLGKSNPSVVMAPQNRREKELAYLDRIGQDEHYRRWHSLYTDMAGTAATAKSRDSRKPSLHAFMELEHGVHQDIHHDDDDDRSKITTLENFDELREVLRHSGRAALIGDPGAGKTTTLERLAYELAEEAVTDEDRPLPLFIRLGAYDGGDFTGFLENSFGGLRLRDYFPNHVFLLLDGLNEIPPEHARKVHRWIETHKNASLIVTCRKVDYVGLKLPLQRVDVTPLDVGRIYLFIGNYLEDEDRDRLFWGLSGKETFESWKWYQLHTPDSTFYDFWFGSDEPGFTFEPERRHLDQIRAGLRQDDHSLPSMLGIVSNPFLLYITINIFVQEGKPPTNRGQLFEHFVQKLMDENGKQAVRPNRPWISKKVQKRALSRLAYQMQTNHMGTSVSVEWARKILRGEHLVKDPNHLLYFAASANIIEWGEDIRFTHQLLQEFFAAYQIREDIRQGVPATKYFPNDEWWESTGWEETIFLLAGMEGDATRLVEWLTPVQPTLAYRCATESGATCAEDALQMLYDPLIPSLPDQGTISNIDTWRDKLPRITPLARIHWGWQLAERNDNRQGVSVQIDGLPDIDWVEVPAGTFQYGGDSKAWNSANAAEIDLSTFSIARYPITYMQYQSFIDDLQGIHNPVIDWFEGLAASGLDRHLKEQYFKRLNHPRETVNWYQAIAFCRWLSYRMGGDYKLDNVMNWAVRLPTEQEWEKAARGTDGRSYPWGDEYRSGYANLDETFNNTGSYFLRQTSAVGMYPQGVSPYGAMDMSGNVWEWCLTEYESGINDELTNDNARTLRGGSWAYLVDDARAANRLGHDPLGRNFAFGFRVVSRFLG